MKIEFRVSRRIHVISAFMFAAVIFFIFWFNSETKPEYGTGSWFIYFILNFIYFLSIILSILWLFRKKIVVRDDRIEVTGIFRMKKYYFREITGYMRDENNNFYIIIADDKNDKMIYISDIYERRDDLIKWVKDNFKYLYGL